MVKWQSGLLSLDLASGWLSFWWPWALSFPKGPPSNAFLASLGWQPSVLSKNVTAPKFFPTTQVKIHSFSHSTTSISHMPPSQFYSNYPLSSCSLTIRYYPRPCLGFALNISQYMGPTCSLEASSSASSFCQLPYLNLRVLENPCPHSSPPLCWCSFHLTTICFPISSWFPVAGTGALSQGYNFAGP